MTKHDNWFKKTLHKLQFWKTSEDILNQNTFDNIFNNIFASKESERKKIINLLEKQNIDNLLFYTDIRNIKHILEKGIEPISEIRIDDNEKYVVWSFMQKQNSINLEFATSSRANFWKWADKTSLDPQKMVIIGLNPRKLYRDTKNDWFFDKYLNFVKVSETIPPDIIDWILIRDIRYYLPVKKLIKESMLNIETYAIKQENENE